MAGVGITALANSTNAVTTDVTHFANDTSVNVIYKAFSLIFVFLVVGTLPATAKFGGYALWAIVFLLMIGKG